MSGRDVCVRRRCCSAGITTCAPARFQAQYGEAKRTTPARTSRPWTAARHCHVVRRSLLQTTTPFTWLSAGDAAGGAALSGLPGSRRTVLVMPPRSSGTGAAPGSAGAASSSAVAPLPASSPVDSRGRFEARAAPPPPPPRAYRFVQSVAVRVNSARFRLRKRWAARSCSRVLSALGRVAGHLGMPLRPRPGSARGRCGRRRLGPHPGARQPLPPSVWALTCTGLWPRRPARLPRWGRSAGSSSSPAKDRPPWTVASRPARPGSPGLRLGASS